MQWKFMLLCAAAVVLVAGMLVAFRLQQQPRFPYMASPLPDASYTAMAALPGWHSESLEVAPGIRLHGLVRTASGPDKPWVLFFDGNSPNVLRDGQRFLEQLCAAQGWGGAVWAYRGYDSSDGTPDASTFIEDGLKAFAAIAARSPAGGRAVHVVGFSMGSGAAAGVAASSGSGAPASLTLLAPMTVLYHGERTQLLLHRHETLKWLASITSPVLVIHGEQDTTLPVQNGRTVATTLGERATLLELAGVGHYELPTLPATQDAIRAFIAQHTAAVSPGP